MSDLLVTGGTGHLGRFFVPGLREAGRAPVLLGRSESCDLRVDLGNPDALASAAPGLVAVETLVHASHPMRGARPDSPDAPGLVEASVGALARLLGALSALRRVVLISSTVAARPGDVYGVTKRLDEDLLRLHAEERGLATCVLRVSSVYGPEATVERALARFLRMALAGETPVVTGSDGPGTDYVHVEDAARAIVAAVVGDAAGTCHVTGGAAATPLEAARAALRAAGREDEPEHRPGSPWGGGGPISNEDAFHALGWRPRYDLHEGLRSYAAWMRAVRT